MYRSSQSRWTHQTPYSAQGYPTTSPGPMPGTPHIHTVSLPHPNSAPHYASASQHHSSYGQGSSGIGQLNPLLSASGTGVLPLYYNVTKDVQHIRFQQGCLQNLIDAPAIHPSCPLLVLSVPMLPLWHTIEVRNPGGVTVRDVLVRIRDVLNRSVSTAEVNSMVSISAVFASASEYFRARTHAGPREFAQGVKRIDFLGPNILFAGLSRSMDGRDRWEVRFVQGA